MKKQTAILFYGLSIYALVQFAWWAFYLIRLVSKIKTPDTQHKQMVMIIGEGLVFFGILVLGLWVIHRSFTKEIRFSQRQNNFLLSVTHELKTPLATNKLYLQTLLKRSSIDRNQQEELIHKALEENKRLENMVENILTATQIESNSMEFNLQPLNLSETIAKIVENWASNRIKINLSIEKDVHVKADASMLQIVLHNLLDNALKYGGADVLIEVYVKKAVTKILWGVRDNGYTIPLSERKDIFKKFVRLGNEETRSQKGTGLGLYIVKQMVTLHGDRIDYFENNPKGSDFRITVFVPQM